MCTSDSLIGCINIGLLLFDIFINILCIAFGVYIGYYMMCEIWGKESIKDTNGRCLRCGGKLK